MNVSACCNRIYINMLKQNHINLPKKLQKSSEKRLEEGDMTSDSTKIYRNY